MEKPVQEAILKMDAATLRYCSAEPPDLAAIRRGHYPAGTMKEFEFPSRASLDGMLRDFSMFSLNAVLKLARNGVLQPQQQHSVFEELSRPYLNFFNYFDLAELCGSVREVDAAIGAGLHAADFTALVTSLYRLANRYAAWSFHYFPWQPDQATARKIGSAVAANSNVETLQATNTRIRLTWQPLNVSVEAWLATDLNSELWDEFLQALPFSVLQDHAVVAGQSMLAWTPVVLSAPIKFTEIIREAPVGRLRFSQATGQKIVVQYGATTENMAAPVLGGVVDHDIGLLGQVGAAIWQSTFVNKTRHFLTVEMR